MVLITKGVLHFDSRRAFANKQWSHQARKATRTFLTVILHTCRLFKRQKKNTPSRK